MNCRRQLRDDIGDRERRGVANETRRAAGTAAERRASVSRRQRRLPAGRRRLFAPASGPGIRCLIEGGIRIDTHGRSTSYGPGGAWFESGPEPVFAQAAPDRPSRFIRVMILPQSLLGKSSIQYVNEEDKAKPKSQSYKVFADMPIALRGRARRGVSLIRKARTRRRNQTSTGRVCAAK